MKKILLTLSLTALLLFTAGCSCPFSDKTADSKPQMNTAAASAAEAAPDFSYKELGSGKTMRLSDLKGKPVFINFWATWCPPCVGELPHIEKKYAEYKDKMHFVILSVDDNEQDPARFIKSKGWSWFRINRAKNNIFNLGPGLLRIFYNLDFPHHSFSIIKVGL